MFNGQVAIKKHLDNLNDHLERENPLLLEAVKTFRDLDKIAYRIGLLNRSESYAMRVPWWPMIAVLGTFSSGKSSFINHYLGEPLQATGNQAVDDRFTVICNGPSGICRTLPGLSLDADPRFPFYKISRDISAVNAEDGRRIDSFLRMKISHNRKLRGRILIDSPGFDADAQRTSTLRIVDHIINLADLVLVFFDARHPEPGAMQDTLKHLVGDTISRPDADKFLFILNQIDNTAREDNPEEVFGAWQRALAQKGLTAGRMYTIYNPSVAVPIADIACRERFEHKRDQDLSAIYSRMNQVEVERSYRIIGVLEQSAKDIEMQIIPLVTAALQQWRRRILWLELISLAMVLLVSVVILTKMDWWPFLISASMSAITTWLMVTVIAGAGLCAHYFIREFTAQSVIRQLQRNTKISAQIREDVLRVFIHNTKWWRSSWYAHVSGWSAKIRKKISQVLDTASGHVQRLNDCFADPSGNVYSRTETESSCTADPSVSTASTRRT